MATSRTDDSGDLLVPAPWPSRRRIAAVVVAAMVVVLGVVLVRSGLLGPALRLEGPTTGGGTYEEDTGTASAFREVTLTNQGWLSVTVTRFEPPTLPGVDWGDTDPPLPVTIEPRGSIAVAVHLRVDDCRAVDGRGLTHLPLRARSGLAPARIVRLRAASVSSPSWDGARPQSASWITDVLEPLCTIPDR